MTMNHSFTLNYRVASIAQPIGTPRYISRNPEHAYTSALLGVYELNRIELLRDVYVSSYEQTAHRIHEDDDRDVTPTLLELQFYAQIKDLVAGVFREAHDARYLDTLKQKISQLDDIDERERNDLMDIVVEKSRKATANSRYQYSTTAEEFRAWNQRRPFYINSETIPIARD